MHVFTRYYYTVSVEKNLFLSFVGGFDTFIVCFVALSGFLLVIFFRVEDDFFESLLFEFVREIHCLDSDKQIRKSSVEEDEAPDHHGNPREYKEY